MPDALKDMRNLADLRMSVHEEQRRWYARIGMTLTLGSLLSSAVLLMFVFVNDEFVHDALHLSPLQFKLIGGLAAASGFSLSIIDLVWRPGGHAESHASARDYFAALKADVVRAQTSEPDESDAAALRSRFHQGAIPRIPDERFLRLKARYHSKVALSNAIHENPGVPISKLRRRRRG